VQTALGLVSGQQPPRAQAENSARTEKRNLRILVVEDNEFNQELLYRSRSVTP
jgi:hypothetical protein